MARNKKMYKSLGLKRTWALSVGAATILGGLGTATILTRYFGATEIATNTQIDSFWETVENNSASFFEVSSTNNKDGEATFQFQESTFLNFIERNHIKDNFIIELNQQITFENSEGEEVTQEWVSEFTIDNLNELSRTALYKDATFKFKLQIQDGEWKEIASPFDRQNFEHPTGLRAPKLFSVTGIEDNDSIYALVNYPNELFAKIDGIVDTDNPTDQDMFDIADIILAEPEDTVYTVNNFSMIKGAFDTSIWVDVYFRKTEYAGAGYLFTQENLDRYFVAGEEYTVWLQLNPNATNYSDVRLEADTENKYKEFQIKADPSSWIFNWNNSSIKGRIHDGLEAAIGDESLNVVSGYFDAMSLDLDVLNNAVQEQMVNDAYLSTGHSFDWVNWGTSLEITNGTNGELNELTDINFKVNDINGIFNAPSIEVFNVAIPEGEKRKVAMTAAEIFALIQDAFDAYAAIKQGISGFYSADLADYLVLPSTHEMVWDASTFENALNGETISFTLNPINGFEFDKAIHESTEVIVGSQGVRVDIEVKDLLIPIQTTLRWDGELDLQDSYVGFENNNVTLTDAAVTRANSEIAEYNYSIGKDPSFDYTTLSVGDVVPMKIYADNGYTFTASNNNPLFELNGAYQIINLDYDLNKTQIDLTSVQLRDLISTLVQDVNNWSGNYSGVMTFNIPDVLTGENYVIEMRRPGGDWTRTLTNVSNEEDIEFRVTANHGYIFTQESTTLDIITVEDFIRHDENIDAVWDTTKAWEYLSGAPNSRIDLTIDLDAIARDVFGNNVVITMDIANGTIQADVDRPIFTITPKDGFFLSSQAIYPNIDLSAFVEAAKNQIGPISQAMWETLVNLEFYSKYFVSGESTLEDSIDLTLELEALGITSTFLEHEDKVGESSNRVYNGQTIKVTLSPHRDYEFTNPTDAEYSFVVVGLDYHLDSPATLQSFFEQQYNNSVYANAQTDANHRIDGSYKISSDQLLLNEFSSIESFTTITINGSSDFGAISAGSNEVVFTIDPGNDYYFNDNGNATKTVSMNVAIRELPIQDDWKTVVSITAAIYADMENTLFSNISGVDKIGKLDYAAIMNALTVNYPDITFSIFREDVAVTGDLSDVSNVDEIKLRMSVGEWYKFEVEAGVPVHNVHEDPDDVYFFGNASLSAPIYQSDFEEAMDAMYSIIDSTYVSGSWITNNLEYDEEKIKDEILATNNLSNNAVIDSIVFRDSQGNIATNGQLTNGFTIEVVFSAQTGNAILDNNDNFLTTLTLETQPVTNDNKIAIENIDFISEAAKLALVKKDLSSTQVEFVVEHNGVELNEWSVFDVEVADGVYAQVGFVPPSGDLIGDWTTYHLIMMGSLSGPNSAGYEWTGTGSAEFELLSSSTIAGYGDIYDQLMLTSSYSDITNTSEQELILDSAFAVTGTGKIDPAVLSEFLAVLGGRAIIEFTRETTSGNVSVIDPNTFDQFGNGDMITIKLIANPGYHYFTSRDNNTGIFNVTDEVVARTLTLSTMKEPFPIPEINTSGTFPTIEGFELQAYYDENGGVSYVYNPIGNVEFTNMFDIEINGQKSANVTNGQDVNVTIFYKAFGGFIREQVTAFTFKAVVSSSDTSAASSDMFDGETFNATNGETISYTQAFVEYLDHLAKTGMDYQHISSSVTIGFRHNSRNYGSFGINGSRLEIFAELFGNNYEYEEDHIDGGWAEMRDEMLTDGNYDMAEIDAEYSRIFGSTRSFTNDLALFEDVSTRSSKHGNQTHENIIWAKDALWFGQEKIFERFVEQGFNQSGISDHWLYKELTEPGTKNEISSIKTEVEDYYNSKDKLDTPFFSSLFTDTVSGTGTDFDGMNVGTFLSEFFSNYEEWFGAGNLYNLNISNTLPSGESIIRNAASTTAIANFLENHSFYLTSELELIFGMLLGDSTLAGAASFAPRFSSLYSTRNDWASFPSHINSGWTQTMHQAASMPIYLQRNSNWSTDDYDIFETWKNTSSGPFVSTLENKDTMNTNNYGKALLDWMKTIERDTFDSQSTFSGKVHSMFNYLTDYQVGHITGDNPFVLISSGTGQWNGAGEIQTSHYPGLMSLATNPYYDIDYQTVRDQSDITGWVLDLINNNKAYFDTVKLNQIANDSNRTSTTTTTFATHAPQAVTSNVFATEANDIYKK